MNNLEKLKNAKAFEPPLFITVPTWDDLWKFWKEPNFPEWEEGERDPKLAIKYIDDFAYFPQPYATFLNGVPRERLMIINYKQNSFVFLHPPEESHRELIILSYDEYKEFKSWWIQNIKSRGFYYAFPGKWIGPGKCAVCISNEPPEYYEIAFYNADLNVSAQPSWEYIEGNWKIPFDVVQESNPFVAASLELKKQRKLLVNDGKLIVEYGAILYPYYGQLLENRIVKNLFFYYSRTEDTLTVF